MSAQTYVRRGCCYCGKIQGATHTEAAGLECIMSRRLPLAELNKLSTNRYLGASAEGLIAHLGWRVEAKETP